MGPKLEESHYNYSLADNTKLNLTVNDGEEGKSSKFDTVFINKFINEIFDSLRKGDEY